MNNSPSLAGEPEAFVRERYTAAAHTVESALCCAVDYAADLLAIIPEEVIEKDYGCGDPTPYVKTGDCVVDLGAGAGKLCFILAQVVGPQGRVIGVDCNRDMLAVARRHQATVAQRLGYANVEFRYGLIQDLALDLDLLNEQIAHNPISDVHQWLTLRSQEEQLRRTSPLIPDASVDSVVSNCVLNLVRSQDRRHLFAEIFRVLRPGGRVAISDIVADQDVPEALQADPVLWSGCISGAFREDRLLRACEEAGFHGTHIAKRQRQPWRTVAGIEFRAVTIQGFKANSEENRMLMEGIGPCCGPDIACC